MTKSIIEELVSQRRPYSHTGAFSSEPGIYALFFVGKEFPLAGCYPKEGEIIYIGKTESSQASRDRDTHFASGKTGSSTLRRSFGAMLRKEMNLKPIPRGQADIEKNRTSHFKFDGPSEEKLTKWMRSNLGLSFYPYNRSKSEIDELETELIQELTPILNIDRKNAANPFKPVIQLLRKETGLIAYGNPMPSKPKATPVSKAKLETPQKPKIMSAIDTSAVHKYEDIWKQLVPKITEAVTAGKSLELNLGRTAFDRVGNRKSYSFRLDLNNGRVANNIGGSAVARDLARVLESNAPFMNAAKGKGLVFRLDGKFVFTVK